jgi:hypothetical protein
MRHFFKGFALTQIILLPTLYYIHSFETQINYIDLSIYSVCLFSFLSIILYIFLGRSVAHPNKQLFLSITLANMITKMLFSILLLVIYKLVTKPADGKFIIPFICIYLFFTIFETWFMIKMANEKS